MNKNLFKETIGSFMRRIFSCFSILVLVISISGLINNTDVNSSYLTVDQIMSFFKFSVLFAVIFGACDFIKNAIIRRSTQFVLTMANVAFVFVKGSSYVQQSQNKPFAVMMIFFFAVIVYVILSLIYLIFNVITKKIFTSEENYNEVYKKD